MNIAIELIDEIQEDKYLRINYYFFCDLPFVEECNFCDYDDYDEES